MVSSKKAQGYRHNLSHFEYLARGARTKMSLIRDGWRDELAHPASRRLELMIDYVRLLEDLSGPRATKSLGRPRDKPLKVLVRDFRVFAFY